MAENEEDLTTDTNVSVWAWYIEILNASGPVTSDHHNHQKKGDRCSLPVLSRNRKFAVDCH